MPGRRLFARCSRWIGALMHAVRGFTAARAGNVAMMFGFAVIPITIAAGSAVDLSRAAVVKTRLGNALDAAALAVGGMQGLSDAEIRAAAQRFFDANFARDVNMGTPGDLTITTTERTITVSTCAQLDTLMMTIVNVSYLTICASSEITREFKGLEVVMALDTTGSMGDAGKMDALKQAANDLVSILFGTSNTSANLKIGVVPFAAAVRFDPQTAVNLGFLDTTGASSVARLNFDNNRFAWSIYTPLTGNQASHQLNSQRWRGCVEARPGNLEELDTAPTPGQPDTYWVPFFAPDGPNNPPSGQTPRGFPNNYISDGIAITAANWLQRLMNSAKYANVNNAGMHVGCEMQTVLPLTNSRTAITDKINALNPEGYTHIALGLAWGWRVISPTAPFTEGVAYNDPRTNKAIILMTDGVNTVPTNSSPLGSLYTAYGYLSQARLGTTNSGTAVTNMNSATARTCTNIKANNIRLYTILLMETNTTVRNLLRTCATTTAMFYESPSAAQLQTVFRAIAAELSNLRISR